MLVRSKVKKSKHRNTNLNNSVYRAGLLTESAEDALRHVYVVTRGPAAAVLSFLRFNCDSLGRTDSFTQLTGNTPLLRQMIIVI